MREHITAIILSCLFTFSCAEKKAETISVNASQPILPVLTKKSKNRVLDISMVIPDSLSSFTINALKFTLEGTTDISDIAQASVLYNNENNFAESRELGSTPDISHQFSITINQELQPGENYFWLSVRLAENPRLTNKIGARLLSASFENGTEITPELEANNNSQRIGLALKQAGEDGIDTYRIPGLATTNKGTLIAVYDNRYNDPVDLQEDIDVGMSRSTDGGQTWEPMKVIMDMGEYGGLPEEQNGIGDPAVLVDRKTNTIWVAALWLHGYPGQRAWNASQPGMSPKQTGQLMLVKSEDDGLSWSDPINITPQAKNPEWQLFFNGPGKGISMEDGTLVFPAQYKDSERIPHSTIIYSKDAGKTWVSGTGAKSETTEAQLVQLSDGSLMLNMRDDRNRAERRDSINGRSVAISRDLGKTWEEHGSSRKALPEPNCMASIIAYEHPGLGKVLLFSNPNSKTTREHITIKSSFDEGNTWPSENQIELYEADTYGYSCLTLIDEDYLGILYEGNKELYFQKIPLNELINP